MSDTKLIDSKVKFEYKNNQELSSDEEDQKHVSVDDDIKNATDLVFGDKNRLLNGFKQEEEDEDASETESKIKRKPVWQDSGKKLFFLNKYKFFYNFLFFILKMMTTLKRVLFLRLKKDLNICSKLMMDQNIKKF